MADQIAPSTLASDAEREHACALLRQASVEGRLPLDEFTQRVEAALVARTRGELEVVTRDLPAASTAPGAHTPPADRSLAVLGSVDNRGFWRVGAYHRAVAVLGSCKLDLRGAAISAPVTVIDALVVMGGLEVIVPEGIEARLEGPAVLSGASLKLKGGAPRPDAPVVLVRATTVLGSVTVRDRASLGEWLRTTVEQSIRRL